jgi:riboflavin kinase/FMN adenylyltransferase
LSPLAIVHSANEWVTRFGAMRPATSLTIGNFDGVHLGHQKILLAVVERARSSNLMSTVVTFDPHPAQVLKPAAAPTMLETIQQRCEHFREMGVDAVLVQEFDARFAAIQASDFVQHFLVETLGVRDIFVGENFRFGQKQQGDVKLLESSGAAAGFTVNIVEPFALDGVVISSSGVRQALRDGRVGDARAMLGRPFALAGEIQTGTGMGRKLIVPTLNLKTDQETLPKNGVYLTQTVVAGQTYGSVTNIGVRPTFDGTRLAIESHLFGFSQYVTSGAMDVRFWDRLRDERKFSGPGELKTKVLQDIEKAKQMYASLPAAKMEAT